jgi:hypothetical protein
MIRQLLMQWRMLPAIDFIIIVVIVVIIVIIVLSNVVLMDGAIYNVVGNADNDRDRCL